MIGLLYLRFDEFQRTPKLAPDFADAQQNLEIALEQRRRPIP